MATRNAARQRFDQTRPAVPQLRTILRDRIIRNVLAPMSRLSEPETAAAYGVSRQPVREAFISLAGEGLLEVRPQSGTYVRRIDCEAVLSGRFVREAVEADVVARLRPDPALLADLRAQIGAQRRAAPGDPERMIALDETFHQTLAAAAGMPRVWDHLVGIKAQMDRVRFLTLEAFPSGTIVDQHGTIVDLIEAGEPMRAATAMREHLREILAVLPEMLRLHPDHFENAEAVTLRTTHHDGGGRP